MQGKRGELAPACFEEISSKVPTQWAVPFSDEEVSRDCVTDVGWACDYVACASKDLL